MRCAQHLAARRGVFKRGGADAGAGMLSRHMESTPYLTGQFLLAMPGIGDPRFERAVIAMCAHDEKARSASASARRSTGSALHDAARHSSRSSPAARPMRRCISAARSSRGAASCSIRTDLGRAGHDRRRRALGACRARSTCCARSPRATGQRAGWSRSAMPAGARGSWTSEMTRHGWFNVPGDDGAAVRWTQPPLGARRSQRAGIDPRCSRALTGTA